MIEDWLPLLEEEAERFAAARCFQTPPQEAEQALQSAVLAPLPELAWVVAAGPDATEFLHNQLSNDVKGLAVGRSRLAAYCSPKGRMLALLRLLRVPEGFRLLLPQELVAPLLPRLKMFVLRSKVSLREDGERLTLGVAGAEALELLAQLAGPLPAADEVSDIDGGVLLGLPGSQPRVLLCAEREAMRGYWQQLRAVATAVGPAAWELLDIRAGLPQIYAATQEAFVPQMANLDLIGGIDFQKGCYPGQEIVARMHYLGTLKRRMFRLGVAGEPPAPGSEVRDSSGGLIGQVVRAAPCGAERAELLAVLQIERAQGGDLHVDAHDLRLLELPYALGQEQPD
jgi:tRNA-modifying protein YgfZ